MSLTEPSHVSMRAEEQALKMLFPGVGDSTTNIIGDIFEKDSYFEEDSKHEADNDLFIATGYGLADKQSFGHAAELLDRSSPQPWRKGLWCLNETSTSELVVGKTRCTRDTPPINIISPADLITKDELVSRVHRTTRQLSQTKTLSPLCAKQKALTTMNLSPSPAYASIDQRVDAWQQDFQNFNINTAEQNGEVFALQQGFDRDFLHVQHSNYGPDQSNQRSTSLHGTAFAQSVQPNYNTLPVFDPNLRILNQNLYATAQKGFQFINEDTPFLPDWTSESLSYSSHNSQNSHSSLENQKRFMHNTLPQQIWSAPLPGAITHHNEHYPMLIQPRPRAATHHIVKQHQANPMPFDMFSSTDQIGLAIPYHPDTIDTTIPPVPQIPIQHKKCQKTTQNFAQPPVLHPYGYHMDASIHRSPHRSRNPERTPSPQESPNRHGRLMKQRSPSRRDPSQSRRKSLSRHGPRDVQESPGRRSTSRPRQPKTPTKKAKDGFGMVDFVNFTPRDAAKLTSDVAPSGSSKTRMRREQEARDKRKLLSEAALQAVREAGGDVEALERAIPVLL